MSSVIRTPFSDIGGCLMTHQSTRRCEDFELRYVECIEAYGVFKGRRMCADYYDDFKECVLQTKQNARVDAMKAERKRQYWAGERSKDNLYMKPPNPDVF